MSSLKSEADHLIEDTLKKAKEVYKREKQKQLYQFCLLCPEGYAKFGLPGGTPACRTCVCNEARAEFEPEEPFTLENLEKDVRELIHIFRQKSRKSRN